MRIDKNKSTFILIGCSAFILLLFRHLYILNPNLGWTDSAPYKLILIEIISLIVGAVALLCIGSARETDFKKSDYIFMLVLSGVAFVACYIGSISWFSLPDVLAFMDVRPLYMPAKLAQLTPYFAIIPIVMTYFYVEEDVKKRTWITILVMAFCVITSAFLPKALTGIYLMLMVCCIVFGIKEAKDNQFNWYLMGAVVLLALVATVIAYLKSGCSSVEHFVIYQYENSVSYIEGEWKSASVFDGTFATAVQSTGFISGTKCDLKLLWTGCYDAPVNVLLAYGWLPFILHAASSIVLAICSIKLLRDIKNDIMKNIGYAIIAKIIATTLFAYFMLPRTATPLGIRTAHFDFDLVWLIVLVAMVVRDCKEE